MIYFLSGCGGGGEGEGERGGRGGVEEEGRGGKGLATPKQSPPPTHPHTSYSCQKVHFYDAKNLHFFFPMQMSMILNTTCKHHVQD